jgi:hypothetical protein
LNQNTIQPDQSIRSILRLGYESEDRLCPFAIAAAILATIGSAECADAAANAPWPARFPRTLLSAQDAEAAKANARRAIDAAPIGQFSGWMRALRSIPIAGRPQAALEDRKVQSTGNLGRHRNREWHERYLAEAVL